MSEFQERDLVVIGAGPGGYVAALLAAKKGLRVTLVERRFVGGTCLNVGCIPTKAIVRSADVYQEAKNAAHYGVGAENVSVDYARIRARKDGIVRTLVDGVSFLLEKAGVEVLVGSASFTDARTVVVKDAEATRTLLARHVIIATGAKTRRLPIPGFDLPKVVDSEGILAMETLPKSLIVVGGGIIGIEFAFAYARLGVKVDVLEALPEILPMADRDAVSRLLRFAKQARIGVETAVRIVTAETAGDGVAIRYRKDDVEKTLSADLVLSAVGRVPELSGLGLENTGVALSQNGGIAVDERMRTNIPGIHAIGDVTNLVQLAHVASRQAAVAVEDILGIPTVMDYRFVPSVLYTTPTVAWVGMSEAELNRRGIPFRVTKSPFSANGRALILNQPLGFVKLIRDERTGALVGATILGDGADELIATITVAMQNGVTAEALEATIFAHPTVSETIREAAAGVLGGAIHYTE
ncbi:MAG: dihydrolipoyl dehydrogenase [Candidatus Izemoplasmatales bacterium]